MNIRKIYQAALLILLSALLIVGITVAGMFSFIWITSHEKQSWNVSMEQISSVLKKTEQGYRLTDSSLLSKNELWAILIDEQGEVIWEWEKPQEIPNRYTLTDVASFSRWYLKDYPVNYIEELSDSEYRSRYQVVDISDKIKVLKSLL